MRSEDKNRSGIWIPDHAQPSLRKGFTVGNGEENVALKLRPLLFTMHHMCGRFTLYSPSDVIQEYFELTDLYPFAANYNVAPSQPVLALRENEIKERLAVPLNWGLIPRWMKEDKISSSNMINARVETVHEKPSFKSPFKYHRCLIAANGYYEWKKEKDHKQPTYMHLENDHPFGFAGIWEHWQNADGSVIESCAILTQEANKQLSEVHHRMPVIINKDNFAAWLDTQNQDVNDIQTLLSSIAFPSMQITPVSTMVNNPRNNTPECIKKA